MESNKLLIGVQFIDPMVNNKSLVFELIVLRDLTLNQLIDGIKYGLAKKGDVRAAGSCSRSAFPHATVPDCTGRLH